MLQQPLLIHVFWLQFPLDVLPPPRMPSWPSPILTLLNLWLILSTDYDAYAPKCPYRYASTPGHHPSLCLLNPTSYNSYVPEVPSNILN
ncbi:hypothetical protein O181_067801 [Austropuccinia psidii MF-1]|uniref:Secreted protein n=1 Tax=Austropuccinia psidii MF-1 TaxID=1389203 RepID=A0A9Q3I3E7_9BASI|nr:hypothetical protein [Austropuccinia psidii MF-1]